VYIGLLPQSGFESIDHIRNRLLWHFTEEWIDRLLSSDYPPFLERDGLLYTNMTRQHEIRLPDWQTASHALIEQDGSHAVIKTTVYLAHFADFENPADGSEGELQLRFYFVDGLIDYSPDFPRFIE